MSLQEKRLLFAMELSNKNWKVAAAKNRRRSQEPEVRSQRERIISGRSGVLAFEAGLS